MIKVFVRKFCSFKIIGGLVPALLLISSVVLAQTDTGKIEGYVRDKDTAAPIAGAQVKVEGTRLGNITNEDGYYFILNVPVGLRDINCSFTGYQKTTVSGKHSLAGQTARVDFQLSSTVISLEGITVESEAEPLIVRDNTVTKQRQTGGEISKLPVSDLDEVIGLQGGVISSGKHFSIRGGRVGEEAVYVDGVLMKSFGAEATMPPLVGKTQYDDLSIYVASVQVDNSPLDLNMNAVEEISIITGGFNAEYGSAKSGVINIVTKEGKQQYAGNVRFRTDEVLQRTMSFGFNELSGGFGGPVPLVPFAYFNLSTELQGQADAPHSTDSRYGFHSVDQVVVDRINQALQGTPYMLASLDLLPQWSYPNPARRPGARDNRYALSEKITASPFKNLKFLQTANVSRVQRQHYRHNNSYRGGVYSEDHERGKVHSLLLGADYTIHQTSKRSMTIQVRANYFQDESAMGQVYNPTGYYYNIEHHDPEELMEIYALNFGDLWDQPVNAALSPVTNREAIENFMFNDPDFANVPKLSLQGGIPVDWDLIPPPQPEFLNFPWKDWVMTTEYWNKKYPLSGGDWDFAKPAIVDLRNVMTNDDALKETYPYPLPGGPSWYYRGALGLVNGGTFWPGGYNINYGFRNDKKLNLKLDFDSQLDRFNRLKVGVDLQYFDLYNYTNGQSDWIVTVIDNNPYLLSSYVQDRFDLGDFVVDLGLRLEMLDPQGEGISFMGVAGTENARRLLMDRGIKKQYEFAPRLGVAFPVTDKTQVRFSYGKFYQPPSFRNLFRGDNIDTQSALLDYSETTMMEAGFTMMFLNDLAIDCVGYNKDIVGDFTYRRISRSNSLELFPAITNMDNGNVKGLDANIQFKWRQYLNTRVTYSLQFARATGSDPIPALNTSTLTLTDPITQRVLYLPVLVSPTAYDHTHKLNTQVYLSFPRNFSPGRLAGKVLGNTNFSLLYNLITGGPFNLGSSWDLVNRGRGSTSFGGNARISKGFSVGGRREVRLFVDIYNLFINRGIVDDRISEGEIKNIFKLTDDIFEKYSYDYYRVNPSSGSYYWDNLHDLDKDGFVEKDEMRLLLLLDNTIARTPGGPVTFLRVGTEFDF